MLELLIFHTRILPVGELCLGFFVFLEFSRPVPYRRGPAHRDGLSATVLFFVGSEREGVNWLNCPYFLSYASPIY